MERETGFEPATPTLARSCSTTELFPPAQEPEGYGKSGSRSRPQGSSAGRDAGRYGGNSGTGTSALPNPRASPRIRQGHRPLQTDAAKSRGRGCSPSSTRGPVPEIGRYMPLDSVDTVVDRYIEKASSMRVKVQVPVWSSPARSRPRTSKRQGPSQPEEAR